MRKVSRSKSSHKDASWLVDKARCCMQDGNPYAAKSWLVTGKTLFPGNFSIQYEEFLMERKAGEIKRCGKLFYDMMVVFSREVILWEELARIFHLQDAHRSQNAETKFSQDMFSSLSEHQQKELLLKYANHQTDIIDKCRISLLVLKRFKGSVCDQAIKLITTLRGAEDKEYNNNPLNIYRKMIVCDVLPLILKNPDVKVGAQTPKRNKKKSSYVTEEQLIYYLNLTMEFLVCYAIDRHSLYGTQQCTDLNVFDLEEKNSCWNLLHEHLVLHATKLNWSNLLKIKDKIDPSKNRTLKSRYKTLNNAKDTKPSISIFYPMLQLYLFTVLEYSSSILSPSTVSPSNENGAENENEYILVEHIDHMTQKDATHQSVIRVPKKKRKTDDSGSYSSDYQSGSEDVTVILHPGLIGHVNESLGECLMVAIDSYHTLKSIFYSEFQQIKEDWHIDSWKWMRVFQIDSLLYQGKFKQSMELINSEMDVSSKLSLKQTLQLASVQFCAGHKQLACEKALDALKYLSSSSFNETSAAAADKKVTKPDGRSLLLLSTNQNDILTYIVQIIFASLKTRLYSDDLHRDTVIGHLIVLSQLMWEINENFFIHLLKLIQVQDGGFKYDLFFNYITHIDVLEEFAYLHSTKSISLDLKQKSSNNKTVTRGVNREVHDDFKSLMTRQIQRSNQPIRRIIFEFLSNAKESILKTL